MNNQRLLFALCLALLGAIGCNRPEPKSSGPKKLVIAVIPKGSTHEYWKSIHAGAMKAAGELGVDILWKGPLKEDDREAQIKVIEDLTSRGVDGIVIAPLDEQALRGPVNNATRAGIPVVIVDSPLSGADYVSYAATDNFAGGKKAGEELCRLLGGQGRVAMLRCDVGSASTEAREAGWEAAIRECPGLKVVSDNEYGGVTTEHAFQVSENILSRLTDRSGALGLDGVFCSNESSCFGMLRALQNNGYAGKVRFVGFDCSPKLIEAMRAGQIDALVVQNPFMMGYLGVKNIVAHLRGQQIEKKIGTGETLVTSANMDQPEIKELLHPDLKKWLGE